MKVVLKVDPMPTGPESELTEKDFKQREIAAFRWDRRICIFCGIVAISAPLWGIPLGLLLALSTPKQRNLNDLFIPIGGIILGVALAASIGLFLSLTSVALARRKPIGNSPRVLAGIGIAIDGTTLFCVVLLLRGNF